MESESRGCEMGDQQERVWELILSCLVNIDRDRYDVSSN